MADSCVIMLLRPPVWAPPGVDPADWWRALAEDTADLLAGLAEVDPAIAASPADAGLADAVRWPSMRVYAANPPTVITALRAAEAAGHQRAAVIASDAPDLPGLLVGKLLRPVTTRAVAAAPAHAGGLVGLAAKLPVPGWLAELDPDLDKTELADLKAAMPRRGAVADAPGWHRLTDPAGLARLDPGLEGWDATRALLS